MMRVAKFGDESQEAQWWYDNCEMVEDALIKAMDAMAANAGKVVADNGSGRRTSTPCRDELEEVLDEWLLLSLSRQLPVPIVDGTDLAVREAA